MDVVRNDFPFVKAEVIAQILLLGNLRSPREACGVLTPDDCVIEVPNRAPPDEQNTYWIQGYDVLMALAQYGKEHFVPESLIFWHTHPCGLIGPSREDVQLKVEGNSCLRHMVVTLPAGEAVIF